MPDFARVWEILQVFARYKPHQKAVIIIGTFIVAYAAYLATAGRPTKPASDQIQVLQPKQRGYVKIIDSKLDDLVAGKGPTIHFIIENAGPVEITGSLGNMTCHFSPFPTDKFLKYGRDPKYSRSKFSLVPGEARSFMLPFDAPVLNEYQIQALNEHKAGLYFFANGEYADETGKTHALPYCRQYDSRAEGSRLIICDDDIQIE